MCIAALLSPASEGPTFTLAVSIQNVAGVTETELEKAKLQTAAIFASIGVTIEWDTAPDKGFHLVIVRSAAAARLGATEDALGLTPSTSAGPGNRAYVFEDRVGERLRELHMAFSHLLGCAMAHELGHMLLPKNPHSEMGIMRAFWDAAHLAVGTSDYLRFTPWQERMIHQKLLAGRR
jgi:hypothetical protein